MSSQGGYIYVRDWERFQHYKDRRPAWIKLYLDLLDNQDYLDLPLAYRAGLQDIWKLVAEVGQGRCSARADYLQKRCSWPAGWAQKIVKRLSDAGFIEVRASKALAPCYQVRTTEGRESPSDSHKSGGARRNGAAPADQMTQAEMDAENEAAERLAVELGI